LSKAHARIQVADGIFSISDLGATNGTSVNGKKLTPYQTYQLRHNDQIKAGSVVFKFLDKP
jgi:pSer/pThr/pTyr-binding forkhead associated (FHA) protein